MLLLLLWIVNPVVFFYTKALYFPLVCATLLLMTAACFYFIACWSALQAAAFMWQHIFCILFWIPIYIGNGISLWSGRCYTSCTSSVYYGYVNALLGETCVVARKFAYPAFVQIVFAHGSVHKLSRLVLLVVFSKLRRVGGEYGLHQGTLPGM